MNLEPTEQDRVDALAKHTDRIYHEEIWPKMCKRMKTPKLRAPVIAVGDAAAFENANQAGRFAGVSGMRIRCSIHDGTIAAGRRWMPATAKLLDAIRVGGWREAARMGLVPDGCLSSIAAGRLIHHSLVGKIPAPKLPPMKYKPETRRGRPVRVNGEAYRSIADAVVSAGLTRPQISYALAGKGIHSREVERVVA